MFNAYEVEFADLVNTIILIVKYYIYVKRTLKDPITFPGIIAAISKYKRIEFIAARITNNVTKHNKKWEMYDCI